MQDLTQIALSNRERRLPSRKQLSRPELETDQEIRRAPLNKPRNVVKKFAFATRVGFKPDTKSNVNQDSFILAPNLKTRPALHAFGVCDGHGKSGRESSNFVKFALPIAIEEGIEDVDLDTDEKIVTLLTEAFISVHDAFHENVPDFQNSGATCTAALLNGHRIFAANCGDSRAILINKYRKITVLTNQHRVEDESERQRILEKGGKINQLVDPKTNQLTD